MHCKIPSSWILKFRHQTNIITTERCFQSDYPLLGPNSTKYLYNNDTGWDWKVMVQGYYGIKMMPYQGKGSNGILKKSVLLSDYCAEVHMQWKTEGF